GADVTERVRTKSLTLAVRRLWYLITWIERARPQCTLARRAPRLMSALDAKRTFDFGMKLRHQVMLVWVASALVGCARQAEFVDPQRRALNVPEVDTREAIPLGVAVHVHPSVVKVSRLWAKNTYGQKVWFGNYGYEVVDAAAEYFPKAFREAWMAPRFPD